MNKEKIREFIRKNPAATYKEIRKNLHLKIERIYSGGMGEAFKDAGINPPRDFKRKTKEEKRRIIIDYIKKHPKAGGQAIKKDTKINFQAIFKDTKGAFEAAGIPYLREEWNLLRKRTKEAKQKEIIELVKNKPEITLQDINKELKTNPYKLFKNFKEIYNRAGMSNISKGRKRAIKKRKLIIDFIRKNPLATQREINRQCKTKVQELFNAGIFEAYKDAGVQFPFARLNFHGSAIKSIKQKAADFEEEIAQKLSCYGRVSRLIKTKRGIADIIFERKEAKVVFELKDYSAHEISISQIKQLNKYLEDIGCNLGILVCHKKPKKDSFLIGNNRIIILEDSELYRIPEIVDKGA